MNLEIHYCQFSPEQGNLLYLGHTNHFYAGGRKSDQTGTLREPFFARSRTVQPFLPELGKVAKEALQESHFSSELGKVTKQALQKKLNKIHHDIIAQSHTEGGYGSSIPCYHQKHQRNTIPP